MVAIAKQHRIIPVVNFQPVRDYILFEEMEPGETAGGIVVPDDADMGPPKGFVVAVGQGRKSEYDPGKTIPMSCKQGDYVYILGTVTAVYLDDKKYGMCQEKNIVAIAPQG